MTVLVTSFYRFIRLSQERLGELQQQLLEQGLQAGVKGLLLLAPEGYNATLCAAAEQLESFRTWMSTLPEFGQLDFKDSRCQAAPFRRWKVEVRNQTIKYADPRLFPGSDTYRHLSPEEFHLLLQDPEVCVVDTRNDYEVQIGKFEGALDPGIETFEQFADFARQGHLPKDKTILLYCTGGIRCEKAILDLESLGYEQCYQLRGGILAYLDKFPEGRFQGECFVFDDRVAVDGHLEPSRRYRFCSACGAPGQHSIRCTTCAEEAVICDQCHHSQGPVCSRRCRQ